MRTRHLFGLTQRSISFSSRLCGKGEGRVQGQSVHDLSEPTKGLQREELNSNNLKQHVRFLGKYLQN